MEGLSNRFDQFVNSNLSVIDNETSLAVIRLVLVLYASLAAPKLPYSVLKLLDNSLFRMAVLFMVVWTANKDPTTSLLIAVSLVVTMNTLAGRKPFETFLIENNTNVIPGCMGLTLTDLRSSFGGDQMALEQALHNSGTPKNIEVNDYNAPLLASYLVNYGYNINTPCSSPGNGTEIVTGV